MSSIAESRLYQDQPYQDESYRRPQRRTQRPGFLTAPFEKLVWRESLHQLVNLPVGIVTFSYAVTMVTTGVGWVLTFVGLPVLAAAVIGCRAFGAMERSRARSTLRLDVPDPAPTHQSRPGLMGWISATLKSGTGWRSVLYSVLMLPFGVVSFSVTLTMWTTGIGFASYPLWQWVYPAFVHQPGLELFDNGDYTYYLGGVPQIAGVCAVGLVFLFLAPWTVRSLSAVQRAMVRGLLR